MDIVRLLFFVFFVLIVYSEVHITWVSCFTNKSTRFLPFGLTIGIDMLTWAYHGTDTLAVNIGLSCELLPPEELLSEYWEKNYGALLHFIQQVIRSWSWSTH